MTLPQAKNAGPPRFRYDARRSNVHSESSVSSSSHIIVILLLIAASGFFSMAEIALAAARKIRLRQLAEAGDLRATAVLGLQEQPGSFFAVVQIGLNAIVILGGVFGESALSPFVTDLLQPLYQGPLLPGISFSLSFIFVTLLFIIFADLIPKRLAMLAPERVALSVVQPMQLCIYLLHPFVIIINGAVNGVFRLFKVPAARHDEVTADDILAMMDAGAQAGVLQKKEHDLIENIFDLELRTVTSSMTARESVVFFTLQESEESIRNRIASYPHSKFLVSDKSIDSIVGYVDAKDMLMRVLAGQSISLLNDSFIRTVLIIPDTLTLSELLERFKAMREDFAVVLNEYALVVGVITLNDVMTTLMGDMVSQMIEEQIIKRDEDSWLIDGVTPVEDVMRALAIEHMPDEENYETVAGFMMYMLRKIPKRTDSVEYAGFKFEVVDIDNYKIDQLLVTRIKNT
jgi:CBS domain containing-hemolysin-like protein